MSGPQQLIASFGGVSSPASGVWNPLDSSSFLTLSESDKLATKHTNDSWVSARELQSRAASDSSGRYFELEVVSIGGAPEGIFVGVSNTSSALSNFVGVDTNGWSYYGNGQKFTNSVGSAYGSAYTTGDIIGVFLRSGKIWFRKNGTWVGDPDADTGEAFSGLTGTLYPTGSFYYFGGSASSLRCISRTGSLPTSGLDWS